MATQRYALPPGIYVVGFKVGTTDKEIANPGGDNMQLYLENKSGHESHKWLICGDGSMRAMNVAMEDGRFAFARTAGSPLTQELQVQRSSSDYKWNVNVRWDSTSPAAYKGIIMAKDSSQRCFGLDSTNSKVQLVAKSVAKEWIFTPA